MSQLMAPLLVAVAAVVVSLWIWTDARAFARAGEPVELRLGGLRIDRPETWAVACLVLCVIVLPVYAVARRS